MNPGLTGHTGPGRPEAPRSLPGAFAQSETPDGRHEPLAPTPF